MTVMLLAKSIILTAMLIGLPLLGVFWAGHPAGRYTQFPPRDQYIQHAPFTGEAFAVFAFMIGAVLIPIAIQGIRA